MTAGAKLNFDLRENLQIYTLRGEVMIKAKPVFFNLTLRKLCSIGFKKRNLFPFLKEANLMPSKIIIILFLNVLDETYFPTL